MNTNLSTKQVEIISNLLIDINSLYNEAQETFLIYNDKFSERLNILMVSYYKFYILTGTTEFTSREILNHLLNLITVLDEFCEDYKERDNIFKNGAYCTMNSFFDRTHEAFEEFINTF